VHLHEQGEIELPSPEDMWKDIQVKKVAMSRRFYDSQRNTLQVDYTSFMDELAELIGCRPNIRE
jgi:dimethylaniline monooxygenase (N-oxide forming)